MDLLIGGQIRKSSNEPIAIKFSLAEITSILEMAKEDRDIMVFYPSGTMKQADVEKFVAPLKVNTSKVKTKNEPLNVTNLTRVPGIGEAEKPAQLPQKDEAEIKTASDFDDIINSQNDQKVDN